MLRMYTLFAENSKPHFTDNLILAQLVCSEYNGQFVIVDTQDDENNHRYHWSGNLMPYGQIMKINLGKVKFSFNISSYLEIFYNLSKWEEKSNSLGRSYVKVYAQNSVLCLTKSQFSSLKSAFVRNYQYYKQLYDSIFPAEVVIEK